MDNMVYDMVKALTTVVRPEEVAIRTDVVISTVNRWISGKSTPHPRQESLIREMYMEYFVENKSNENVNKAIDQCLKQLREAFHKSSRYSSRNEALEEVSKLFFVQIMSVLQGETGITSAIVRSKGQEAQSLSLFVKEHFDKYLRIDNQLDASFSLNLKPTENKYASEIIDIFENSFPDNSLIHELKGTEVLNEIFGKFLANSFIDEKQLGQYLTPQEVVGFSTSLLYSDLSVNEVVSGTFGYILDPSCGIGSFLTSFINHTYKSCKKMGINQFDLREFLQQSVIGVDKSERMLKIALINLAMYGCQDINVHLKNSLDARELHLEGNVAVIMTNPPFGAEFPADEVADFKIVSQWSSKRPQKVNSELLFFEKYLEWLKPDGRLICIVPDSILNNKGLYQSLREGISRDITIHAVISLPQNTFATTGTETKTSLIYLQKKPYDAKHKTYLAVCKNIGYDVVTLGTHKVKKYNGLSELEHILKDYQNGSNKHGEWVTSLNEYFRWDATYHASITNKMMQQILDLDMLKIKDVARLSNERFNPSRYESNRVFQYIEISDVDSIQMRAYGKPVSCGDAPSRARKLVHTNDIIFSTVRPERGTVAVISANQEGFVCTTGFAVLQTLGIEPMVLAYLLQSNFVSMQINKYAMGISYPVIDEKDLLEIYLPIKRDEVYKYDSKAIELKEKEHEVAILRENFKMQIETSMIEV